MKKIISFVLLTIIFSGNVCIPRQSVFAVGTALYSNDKYIKQSEATLDAYIEKQQLKLLEDSEIIDKLTTIRGKIEKLKQKRQQMNTYTGPVASLIESFLIVIDAKIQELSGDTNTDNTALGKVIFSKDL